MVPKLTTRIKINRWNQSIRLVPILMDGINFRQWY